MDESMEVLPAAVLPLQHRPVPAATDGQTSGEVELGGFGDGVFGVWEITPGTSEDVEVDEVSVVLAGRGTVEDLGTGEVLRLEPGTVLRLRAGTRTRWSIAETLRKVYVVR